MFVFDVFNGVVDFLLLWVGPLGLVFLVLLLPVVFFCCWMDGVVELRTSNCELSTSSNLEECDG